jgi:hypothetical protein
LKKGGEEELIRKLEERGHCGLGSHRMWEIRLLNVLQIASFDGRPDVEVAFLCNYGKSTVPEVQKSDRDHQHQ